METEIRQASGAVEAVGRFMASPAAEPLLAMLAAQLAARRSAPDEAPAPPPPAPQAVLDALAAAPHAYHLFAALRLIECAFPQQPRLGQAKLPRDEPVRLGQEPSLAFAPSAIARVEAASAHHPPRLVQRVQGLFGPNGPMPLALSEHAFERAHHAGDTTFARFADLFHHRLISLFYRAWANHQPNVSLDRPEQDRFGAYLGALCGLGMPAFRERGAVADFVKLGHASLYGRQVKSAEGLQIILSNYFGVPVRIEQWQGRWLAIPPSERTRLGCRGGYATLDEDAVIGEQLWDCQSAFRIVLGPLDFADYQRFLPDGPSYGRLVDLARLYIGAELRWDLQLVLERKEVPLSWLGNSVLLGWTSWLGVRLTEQDAADLQLAGPA